MKEIVTNYWNSAQIDPETDGVAPMGCCGKVEIYYRNYFESKHLKRIIECKNKTLLEIGCGAGRWALNLHRNLQQYDGIDLSKPSIEVAKQLMQLKNITNCNFYYCDVNNFNPEIKYDIIYFGGVTQYIKADDLVRLINMLKRWLKPNGIIIDRSTISLESETKINNNSNYFAIYRTANELKNIFIQSGFKPVYQKRSYRFLRLGRIQKFMNYSKIIKLVRSTSPVSYEMMYFFTYIKDFLKPKDYKEYINGSIHRYSHDFIIFSSNEQKQ